MVKKKEGFWDDLKTNTEKGKFDYIYKKMGEKMEGVVSLTVLDDHLLSVYESKTESERDIKQDKETYGNLQNR